MIVNTGGLKLTTITDGLGGNTFNSTHLVRTYGVDKTHDLSANATNMAELFSATDKYQDKPWIAMTEAKGKKIYLSSNQYSWKLRGHQKQKARVVAVVETGTTHGLGKGTFDVVLDLPWYKYPDVLVGQDEDYPVEVVGEPSPYSTIGWKYTLRLQTDNNNLTFPDALIQVGQEFHKNGTSIADEMNQDYGTMQFNSVFELRSQTGNVAEEVNFSDKALRVDKNSGNKVQKLAHWRVPFLDNKGKTYYNFMPMAEAEVWNGIYEDCEWGLQYGRKSTRVGPQGYLKRTGPGFREQQEDGNVLYHNGNLTLARLDDWISSIFTGRKDATSANRRLVLSTGEQGAIMFHNMVASDASQFFTTDSHYIRGKDFRHMSYGLQFTHYVGKNGLDISVMIDPSKDNPDMARKTHPLYPDKTIDSYRMDIIDFGYTGDQSKAGMDNISMVCEEFADYYFCSTGKWDPKSGMPINDGSPGLAGGVGGYGIKVEKSFGLMVRDITRCGAVILQYDN